jgi:hypothetical protein
MPSALRQGLAADAVLYTAGCATIAAPVAGVAVAAAKRSLLSAHDGRLDVRRTTWPLIVAALLFAMVSALLTFGWSIGREDATAFVATSHATLIAVALALAAWGAFCGGCFRDPLDAAAVSLIVVLMAAVGLFVAGASVADVPRQLVALALTANPLVVIAAAANIDIVRMDLLYQISPLAHTQVDYPAWHIASVWYLGLAFLCFLGLTLRFRTRQSVSTT